MKKILALVVFTLTVVFGYSQNIYNMQTGGIQACNGIFKASEKGKTSGHYDHNENYIFTVSVPGATKIDWDFKSFCTEKDLDFLKIYRGKDTFGLLIGTYSGNQGPGKFSVNDSFITFHFTSDKSVSCTGWEAEWKSKVVFLPAPILSPIPNLNCKDTELTFTVNKLFRCDSIKTTDIKLTGPRNASANSVSATNCNSDTLSNTFKVSLNSELDRSGTYTLEVTFRILDLCDSLWTFKVIRSFQITNCPIAVDLGPIDTIICRNSCIQLNPMVTGGNPSNYTYTWIQGGLIGAGPHTVCPLQTTTYELEVSDGVSIPGKDTIRVIVLDPPQAQNDTVVCQSSPIFKLNANSLGGKWYGLGVDTSGNFSTAITGSGIKKVWYKVGQCADTVLVDVKPIWAGPSQASCPNASNFPMIQFTPPGGFWTGPKIDSSGIFTPDSGGQFLVTYNWNGCKSNKWVYVDTISIQKYDTSCLSEKDFILNFSPPGGIWAGPGIINARQGRFNPATANFGNKVLTYTLNGCRDTSYMHVIHIDAGPNFTVCPTGGDVNLAPPIPLGGYWHGNGIVDSSLGIFNPAHIPSLAKDSIYYTAVGCTDKIILSAIQTNIQKDSLVVCANSGILTFDSLLLGLNPTNGIWNGVGITNNKFNPAGISAGKYSLFYHANLCSDSIQVEILPEFLIQPDTTLCRGNYNQKLFTSDTIGIWSGPGITNPNKGFFNPSVSGLGTKLIQFTNSKGCKDTTFISVTPLPTVSFIGTAISYCDKDTLWPIVVAPQGGTYSGLGVQDSFLNPKLILNNSSKIYYSKGEGNCLTMDSLTIVKQPPLKLNILAEKQEQCIFENNQLTAKISGGDSSKYSITWSNGNTNVPSIYIFPSQSTNYWVKVSDACSDDQLDTLEIMVHPLPWIEAEVNSPVCFGEDGFAVIRPVDTSQALQIVWNLTPPLFADSIFAKSGAKYVATVTNTLTGCIKDTSLLLPSHPQVKADFRIQTDGNCISPKDENIPIQNLSIGANAGNWIINQNNTYEFVENQNPTIPIPYNQNQISIKLKVKNEFLCEDSMSKSFCIKDTVYLYIPDAFSPNNDGINDLFGIQISTHRFMQFDIYNRWGEMIYSTQDPTFKWNGKYMDKECPTDFYMYKIKYASFGSILEYKSGSFYLLR